MNENIKSELKLYESKLKNKDEYIDLKADTFDKKPTMEGIIVGLGIIMGAIWACAVDDPDGFFFPFALIFKALVCVIVIAIPYFIFTSNNYTDTSNAIDDLKNKIKAHNNTLFKNYIAKTLKENNIQNISKEIIIQSSNYCSEKVLIDDENKTFNIVKFTMPKNINDTSSYSIQKAKYSEILRYSFLDKSTSTQVATSTTSSNSKKALGGAIVSDLLIGDATAGAVIGGSGARTTETTYKTKIINKYQITIYLNKLQDSVITINLESGNITNQIISTLEYILRNK